MRRSLRTEATQSNREAGQSLASQKTLWYREQDQCSQKLHSPLLKGSSLKHPEPFFFSAGKQISIPLVCQRKRTAVRCPWKRQRRPGGRRWLETVNRKALKAPLSGNDYFTLPPRLAWAGMLWNAAMSQRHVTHVACAMLAPRSYVSIQFKLN